MQSPKQAEHDWLQTLVGEWTFEAEGTEGPDKPTQVFRGTESVRSLGGLWTIGEGRMDLPDGGAHISIMTLGYDPLKQRFVGSFVASMVTFQWIYEGTLDAAKRVLTLDTEGPTMEDPSKLTKYHDFVEIVSPDERLLKSEMLSADGKWVPFMTARYRRKK